MVVKTNGDIAAAARVTAGYLALTLDGNTQQVTTDASIEAQRIKIFGQKAWDANGSPTANTNAVAAGMANATPYLPESIAAGGSLLIECAPGTKLKLADLRVRGTATDGVLVMYW